MIGAGVFTTSGFTLADLGSPGRVLVAWVVGGIIAICGAIGYGALARQLTESGGEYLFLSRVLHPAAGFVAGWISLFAGFTGAIAFAAHAFESYVRPADSTLPANAIAVAAIVLRRGRSRRSREAGGLGPERCGGRETAGPCRIHRICRGEVGRWAAVVAGL